MRCGMAVAIGLAMAAGTSVAADGSDAAPPAASVAFPARSAPLPSDVELEARGAWIGGITIKVDEIFDERDPVEGRAPYRLANDLHLMTRDSVVASQLLFHTGDPYSPRRLAETERILRGQRYLHDATVKPVRYNEDNSVDVEVEVRDVWTLNPGIAFGRKGGANHYGFEIEDENFLGLGKSVSLGHSSNVDRSSWLMSYEDPNLLGTWWRLGLDYANSSDGTLRGLSLEQPFYSLDTRWSAGLALLANERVDSRYDLGQVIDEYRTRQSGFDVYGGLSQGLHEGWTHRWLAGFRYDRQRFDAPASEETLLLPEDRTLAWPWVGVEIVEDGYAETRNQDQIGRTEDVFLGRSLTLKAGIADSVFGADRSAFMFSSVSRYGHEFDERHSLFADAGLDGRLESGALAGTVFSAGTRYYWRTGEHHLLHAAFSGALGVNLDDDQQILLGGDSGLRGYPLRYQAGTARALVTVEERYFTDWQPLHLFAVGGALFFDAGRTWGRDPLGGESLGLLKDVGVGLRLGSLRSGLGNVLHIDLAFPLDASADVDQVQLLIETKRSF